MKNLIILLLPLVVWGCGNSNHKSDAYGNFESTEVTVSAEVLGRAMAVNFNEGDALTQGHILCIIDTVPLCLQRDQLMASRQSAQTGVKKVSTNIDVLKAQKQIVERDLARLNQLKAENAATAKQLDDAEGQLTVIDRQIDNAQAQLASVLAEVAVIDSKIASMNDQIARCTIVAPITGTVLNKLVEQGELVAQGKPVAKMANLDQMELRAYISGDELPQLKIGQTVDVLIDADHKTNASMQGTITWISSSAEFTPKIIQTKQERVDQVYAFKVTVKNDGRIKIGMPGEVVIGKEIGMMLRQ
jgi:HlyD family secretion protein